MSLATLWFVLIAVLWGGYFVLEGFDFGVGMLLPFLSRNEKDTDAMFESIGPVWDGNEVWLVVAGGATFAAFPIWYGTMFSGFYIALLLILVFLIVRVVSFEWRGKSESPRWRAVWRWANTVGSAGAPLVWGIGLANLLHGVPLDSKGNYSGDFLDLFSGYTVLAGLAMVLLCMFHGATYLTLRIRGELGERAARAALRLSIPTTVVVVGFLAGTVGVAVDRNERGALGPAIVAAVAAAALVLAVVFSYARRRGMAFVMTALGTLGLVATLFTSLYPRVMVSHPDFGNSLTVSGAASGHYTLEVITIVALILLPLVLLYQGWSYYVFRARVGGEQPAGSPVEALARRGGGAPAK
jgi:cytochrome d ubiquinol oxidase subunit II